METIKKFTVFLIFVLLMSSFAGSAYAKVKSKDIKLSDSTITITIDYQTGDDVWADDTLNLVVDSLKMMENISGVPYPTRVPENPYATKNDTKKANMKICEFTDEIKECKDGFGIGKTQDTTTTVRQIASIWNTDYFERDWLLQGHTSIYTYLLLREINLTEAEKFKTLLFLSYSNLDVDFPLNDWSYLGSVTSERQINKRNYGIAKSFVFMHLIYKNYGIKALTDTRKNLDINEITPDSAEYKKMLESVTNKNLNNLFSGWVFPGEYKIQPEEIKEIEIAMQKYNECFAIYEKSQNKKMYDELMDLRAELYEECNIENSIEHANELIKSYDEIEIAVQKYNEVLVLCNESQNKELCNELTDLHEELYVEGDIEMSIKHADRLLKKNWGLKNETITGYIIAEDITTISKNKYNEAKKLYDEGGVFTRIGLIFYGAKSNLDMSRTELYRGNFAGSIKYSNRAISDIEKAEVFGMVVFTVILLIFIVLLIGVFLRR